MSTEDGIELRVLIHAGIGPMRFLGVGGLSDTTKEQSVEVRNVETYSYRRRTTMV